MVQESSAKMQTECSLRVDSECCLQNAPDTVIAELKRILTIPNPKYIAAKRYARWVGKNFPRKLFYFRERKSGFYFPRGLARKSVELYQESSRAPLQLIDKRQVLPPVGFEFRGELRDYQEKAVRDVLNHEFGVLEAGTGSGKTVMSLAIVAARKQPTFILVHTKELMHQWVERVDQFLGMEAGKVGDGHFSPKVLTVGIVNSVKKRLDELSPMFGHVVVDECHRVPASLFTDVVKGFAAKYSLGLSATAYRREDVLTKLIYFFMGDCVHRIGQRSLQDTGAILRPEIRIRVTTFTYRYRDDYSTMLTVLAQDEERNRLIANDAVNHYKKNGGGVLIVSDRVGHCGRLAELIDTQGIKAEVLTGKVGAEKRQQIVECLQREELPILISTLQLIGEGFDAPGLNTLFLASPIKFSGRLKQVVGRILRPSEGKQAIVYDYVDELVSVLRSSARQRQKTYQSLI